MKGRASGRADGDSLMVLKAELHCHIEGAASPDLVIRQAAEIRRRHLALHQGRLLRLARFHQLPRRLRLRRRPVPHAKRTTRGSPSTISPAWRATAPSIPRSSPRPTMRARPGCRRPPTPTRSAKGMARAKAKTGIEGRMIVTGVRHFGVESVEAAARFAARCGHPLVTGFGMAGEERFGDLEDYVRAFEIAREAGPRHHRACRRARRLGERRGRARPHPAVAHRPRRARHRKPGPRQAHRRRRRRARGLPGLERRAESVRRLRQPSVSGADGGRLQGDAELRRPALFLDQPEAGIRRGGRAFRAWTTRR